MSQYMLMFLLGPVQPFIEEARRTRDLWAGSLLIAKLMEAAMEGIAKETTPGTFVFPAQQKAKAIPDMPNKYVAIFEQLQDAQKAASESIDNVKRCWEKISGNIWQRSIEKAINIDRESKDTAKSIWMRETDFSVLFQIHWAAAERKDNQLYKDWLEETEQLLATCKRLYNFKEQDELSEKITISSNHEILHAKHTDCDSIRNFWKNFAAAYSSNDISQDTTEQLDTIDIVKRFAIQAKVVPSEQVFPSTSSIATASFIEGLLNSKIDSKILEQWWNVTHKDLTLLNPEAANAIPYLVQKAKSLGAGDQKWLLQRDGDLYFPSIFTSHQLKENYSITDPHKVESIITECKEALQEIFHATDANHITRPTPYYAVIKTNGDKMSMLVSGVAEEKEHRNISSALSYFASRTVPQLIEKEYPGRLVYSGGDDVLAFAPLARDNPEIDQPKHVLDLANRLQCEYRKLVKGALPLPQEEKRLQGVTASTGIVIAYHYSPLPSVLRAVREAEHAAKSCYGRNALVVTVLRRSGEQIQVGCHWRYADLTEEGQPIPLFSHFFTLFKKEILSPKCIYVLLKEASALVGLKREIQESEVKRIFLRYFISEKHNEHKEQNDDRKHFIKYEGEQQKEELKHLARHLVNLAGAMDKTVNAQGEQVRPAIDLHVNTQRYGIVETLGWLLVMAFLARKDQE